MGLFGAFAAAQGPLTLTQLAKLMDLPMSSCHQLVHKLRRAGYLYRTEAGGFYPTRRIVDIASAIGLHDPLLQRLDPTLRQLRDDTHETVILGKLEDDHVLYLAVHEGTHTIRYSSEPGAMKPLHSSATGKAILGSLDESTRSLILDRISLTAMTPNTITRRDQLSDDLASCSATGVYVTRGENVRDVMALAVGFRHPVGPMAIAVAGPLDRIEPLSGSIQAALVAVRTQIQGDS